MNAIEIQGGFRIYDAAAGATVALAGIDFTLEAGEIVVALGPSGSGKTTLLRVAAGLERLSAGNARVFGTELGDLTPADAARFRALHAGLLEQHYARALSPDLSCRQSVALQLDLLGTPPGESRSIADGLLARVGLGERAGERPQRLSGGEQQRVAVCAAVAHRPRLLLADEPAGELDSANAAVVYALLAEIVRESGAAALIVSHDRQAASIADRIVEIRDGRVVGEGRPGADPALVVSHEGWLRLPHELAEKAGRRVTPRLAGDDVVLVPAEAASAHPEPTAVGAPGAGTPVAELRAVTKSYGDRIVVRELSRTFASGRLTALVGRSGTGKTTLLHLLAGLERPTSGDVVVGSHAFAHLGRSELARVRREEIALVTQEPGLIPYLSALENVELGLSLRGTAPDPAAAEAALAELGLGHRLHQRASALSAGERERVAIARALAAGARLLLIDEPTARLDEENARLVGRLVARAAHERGVAVVCGTHDPALIELADDIVEL